MQRWIALLRAINVGGHTVKMDRLRTLFGELGLANVETFIASGNVIFEAPSERAAQLTGEIEEHLKHSLGYAVTTFLRTPEELAGVANYQPFPLEEKGSDAPALYVAFLTTTPSPAAQKALLAFRNEIDDFYIQGREVYCLARRNLGASTFSGAALEKTLGLPATMRNITTVRKLAAKYP